MTHTTEKLEAMLAAATPGPWWTDAKYSGVEMGCAIIAARTDSGPLPGNPTRGMVAWSSAILNTESRRCEANARLIALAPTITAELIAARRKLDAVQGLVETVEAYKSASKSEMVIPADRGGQWGPKGSAIAKTLERKGEMFAALAAWEVAQ